MTMLCQKKTHCIWGAYLDDITGSPQVYAHAQLSYPPPPNLEENWLKWIKSVVHAGCMMVEKRINKTLWAASIRDNGATLDTMVQQHKKYITVHSGTLPVDRRERCDIYGRISIQIAGSFSRSSLYNLSVKPHLSHCELWPRSHQ